MDRYFEINESGHNIRCKLSCWDPKNIRSVVVFCHGFGGDKDNASAAKFAERMISKHRTAAMISFDLPCHGKDVKKKLSLQDCDSYLDLIIRHVQKKYGEKIYAYATSFGGYLTLKYIAQHGNPFCRILLRSPAVNLYSAFTQNILSEADRQNLHKGKVVAAGFDRKIPVSEGFLKEVAQYDIRETDYLDYAEDLMILHGTKDEIIPFDAVREFADNNLIEFVPIEGADHRCRDPKKMDQVIKCILEFYNL